jgi:hypothetical protein
MKWFLLSLLALSAAAMADPPKVATFPLGGTSPAATRDRVGYSIRAKLDRDGAYDPIDGPTMLDIASPAKTPIDFNTTVDVLKDLTQDTGAAVLIWGDLSPVDGKDFLRLKTLDLRDKSAEIRTFQRAIPDADHIRFVVEDFLETLPGVTPFTHPDEQPVHHDPASDALFAGNPNLVVDGDFSLPGHWNAIYLSDKYPVAISDQLPARDKVVIYRQPAPDGKTTHVLAMNMSYHAATNNGLACLSDAMEIQAGVRYRLSYRYRSDGPNTQVIVRGYATAPDITGKPADLEVYRMQVPPGGATAGQWQTVEADLNPRNPDSPVQRLRLDLYTNGQPGLIMFDDVVLKAISPPAATRP